MVAIILYDQIQTSLNIDSFNFFNISQIIDNQVDTCWAYSNLNFDFWEHNVKIQLILNGIWDKHVNQCVTMITPSCLLAHMQKKTRFSIFLIVHEMSMLTSVSPWTILHELKSFMFHSLYCKVNLIQLILNGGLWNKWIQKHLLNLGFLFESFFFVYFEMTKKDWISFTELRN